MSGDRTIGRGSMTPILTRELCQEPPTMLRTSGMLLLAQSSGLWGTLDNVWPSSVFNNSGFNDGRNLNRENENALGFDSLSLSSIWSSASPPHQEEGDNTWSSLFTENKKDI